MKVSQHIDAGHLTSSWIRYDGCLQLSFGDDELTAKIDEEQIVSLARHLQGRLNDLVKERQDKMEREKQEELDAESDS
jgi:hypothetical protein